MYKFGQIKRFNDILDQFFDYIEEIFPYYQSEIILIRNGMLLIRKSNARLVVEQFIEYVSPYSKQLYDCDEDFFLNFENNISLNSQNMLFGLKLKSLWLENLNNHTEEEILRQKAIIFNFFHKLLKAAFSVNN